MRATKTMWKAVGTALLAFTILSVVPGVADLAAGQRGWQGGTGGQMGNPQAGQTQTLISSLPLQALSAKEKATLVFMREEEKLARDVYRTLFAKWGSRVFANIAVSEDRHTLAIKALLDRYSVADPVQNDTPGQFSDPALAKLYGDLVAQGFASNAAAFKVGALIEDLDIRDLDNAIAESDNDDLDLVYSNLRAGSTNHMRAFVAQLTALSETYTPQYISKALFDEILATPMGRGQGAGNRQGNQNGMSGQNCQSCPNNQGGQGTGNCTGMGGRRNGQGGTGNPTPGTCPNVP